MHKYYVILSNNHHTFDLLLFRCKECKLVIHSIHAYAFIIFNNNNTVKLLVELIQNYLDYCKIDISSLLTCKTTMTIEDIIYSKTNYVRLNKIILNNTFQVYEKVLYSLIESD